MKHEGLELAQALLKTANAAMENIEEVCDTVGRWDDDGNPPPLLKTVSSYTSDVDKEKFEQFHSLVHFLREAIFGVDVDNDSVVRFSLVHLGMHENVLPTFYVPRADWGDPLDKRFQQVKLAQANADVLQARVDSMRKAIDEDVERLIKLSSMRQRAKDCDVCKGKGWVKTDYETWAALDYQDKCKTELIGCNLNIREKPTWGGGVFRLFCECQKENV
jgi:hypothetical protein